MANLRTIDAKLWAQNSAKDPRICAPSELFFETDLHQFDVLQAP